jgi:hypothetical protein
MRQFKFIAELPPGYEYKIIQTEYIIKIIGIAYDKPPIGFILNGTELERIELDLNNLPV